jgi:hypothetical protein
VVAHGCLEEFTGSLWEKGLSHGEGHEEAGRLIAHELPGIALSTGYGKAVMRRVPPRGEDGNFWKPWRCSGIIPVPVAG